MLKLTYLCIHCLCMLLSKQVVLLLLVVLLFIYVINLL
jgi:hypothetical protein